MKTPTHPYTPFSSRLGKAASARIHWLAMGLGLAASAACGIAIIAQPPGADLRFALAKDDEGRSITALANRDGNGVIAMHALAGVNGETFGPQGANGLSENMLAENADEQHFAPAAWDELSDARCLTLTTHEGQTFSFRIVGVHPKAAPAKDAKPANVELDIAACAQNGEPVVKALIEPDAAAPVAKDLAVFERSL
ncbi:MAG: hypothetical protein ACFCUR_20490 [Rhodomicrobiaceae bacterium]